jgi:hypothetical protein
MSAWFNDHERSKQFRFLVEREHSLKFGVHRREVCGLDAQVNDASTGAANKNQPAKVAVPSHKDATFLLSKPQQIFVRRLCQSDRGNWDNVMPQCDQKPHSRPVNILICQKPHGAVAI